MANKKALSDFGATHESGQTKIEVRVENETVWLTQSQMPDSFQTTRNNITLHIGNIFKEKELDEDSVCKDSLLTASDGKRYKTEFYNLDVIISVGYRVKSKRGTQFRIWANKVLKDYLLKGYAANQGFERIENDVIYLKRKSTNLIFKSRRIYHPMKVYFTTGKYLMPIFSFQIWLKLLINNTDRQLY